MRAEKIKKTKGKFVGREHSMQGLTACSLFGVELIIFMIGIYQSYMHAGQAEIPIGLFGLAVLLLAVVGIVLCFSGFRKKGAYKKRSECIGLILNCAVLVGMIVLYTYGMMQLSA